MSEKTEPEQLRKLFVFRLNYETTEETLKSYFEQWGEIVDCVVMRKVKNNKLKNKSRGFGFLTYKRAHMVDDAQAARPHKIDGRDVKSKRAIPREDSNKPQSLVTVNKLYVSGIKDDLTEDDLREYFGQYGNILSVNIVVDKNTEKRRGFAFVEFDDHDPVDKIICLQRHSYKNRKLEVKKALSRDEMNNIRRKQEMERWHTADEFDESGYGGGSYRGRYSSDYSGRYENDYGGGYENDYGGGYENDYGGGYENDYGGGYGNDYAGGYGNDYGGGYGNDYGGGYEYDYGGGYGNSSAGEWNDSYGNNFYSSDGGSWGEIGSSYGGAGGPMRGITGYSQRNQSPYGGRGSGRYGRR